MQPGAVDVGVCARADGGGKLAPGVAGFAWRPIGVCNAAGEPSFHDCHYPNPGGDGGSDGRETTA